MTFAQLNLHSNIIKALEACGYQQPTPIQAKAIPEIMSGYDVIACAQTGTGKTAAFVLPTLHKLAEVPSKGKPRVLILSPTRELATQITQAVIQYSKFLKLNVVSLVGGMPYRQQLRQLSRPVDIVIATPGRLMDHMDSRRLDLSHLEILILDEADRMLDMGFIDDVQAIAAATPKSRQTLLFSATVDNRLMQVIKQIQKDPVRIDLSNEKVTPAQISQELYMADNQAHKSRLLMHFLREKNIFKAIVFSATKVNADYLAAELSEQGFDAAPLHGDLKQNQRNKTIERLRRGDIQLLVATDVAARGIDINDITHVFNYDLPKFAEDYIHRIGRTGRAGKTGIAVSFATSNDLRHVMRIERLMKQTLERKLIPGLEPTMRKSSEKSSGHRFGDRFSKTGSSSKKRTGGKDFAERRPFNRDEKKFKSGGRDSAERGSFKRDENKFKPRGAESSERRTFGRDEKRFKPRGADSAERGSFGRDEKRFKPRSAESSERGSFNRDEKRFKPRSAESSERGSFNRDEKRFKPRSAESSERGSFGRDEKRFKPRSAGSSERGSFNRDEKRFKPRSAESAERGSFGRDEKRFKPRSAESAERGSFNRDEKRFKPRSAESSDRGSFKRDEKRFKPRSSESSERGSFNRDEKRFKPRSAESSDRGSFSRDEKRFKPRSAESSDRGSFKRDEKKFKSRSTDSAGRGSFKRDEKTFKSRDAKPAQRKSTKPSGEKRLSLGVKRSRKPDSESAFQE